MMPSHQNTDNINRNRDLAPHPALVPPSEPPNHATLSTATDKAQFADSDFYAGNNADILFAEHHDVHDAIVDDLDLHGEDSYIYGDDGDNHHVEVYAATDPTTPAYNPEAEISEERFKGKNEVVNCFSYSRKTGERIGEVELEDVDQVIGAQEVACRGRVEVVLAP